MLARINKGNVAISNDMAQFDNLKIFKLNRIRYQELIEDAINYVKQTYRASNQSFTMASPFA